MQPKWNARTVIRRALIIAETLQKGERPRFKLKGDFPYYNIDEYSDFLGDFETLDKLKEEYPSTSIGSQGWIVNENKWYQYADSGWVTPGTSKYPLSDDALWLQDIETPEFQFTQSTLREVLQEVGRFVHAEPRLINGDTITFDRLGSGEQSEFTDTDYASQSFQQSVDKYATNLHSTVNNFVNSMNYANSVMVEPYSNGFKTVRTENLYLRLEDTNIHIQTQYPIRAVRKLECGYASKYDGAVHDITAFLYESSEYQRLSSYDGVYPQSKAWAIYYTIGEKGIYGLTFKSESAYLQAFKNYAIVNILNAVTNESESSTDYKQLAFRITYEPIYSATVQQNKSYVGDLDKPANLVYNQGQNMVESHYFGENMKGAIARLGNVDKVQSYVKYGLVDTPQIGKFILDNNDEYYISAVASEIYPYYTKFSMSLSKDFNRYSDYVGINSEKRMYEVSERQAFDSHITYKDYVVIGDDNYIYGKINDGLLRWQTTMPGELFIDTFNPVDSGWVDALSLCEIQGYDSSGNGLQKVVLPVQKSAIGNSALFTVKFKDNYSAGDNVVKVDNNFWQNGVAYSDYFGNVEYFDFTFRKDGEMPTDLEKQTQIGNALPIYDYVDNDIKEDDAGSYENDQWISTKNTGKKLWVKKGSTEIPTIDYQIDFVTNRPNIIIGSALAKNLPLVCGILGEEHRAKLCFLTTRINKFEKTISDTSKSYVFWDEWGLDKLEEDTESILTFVFNGNIDENYKAWAIVDGATNELLIGCNKDITTAEDVFKENGKDLKIFIKHDIFKDKI